MDLHGKGKQGEQVMINSMDLLKVMSQMNFTELRPPPLD